jgi:ABC-type branched-subunit amino acid transport system ATPase component
MTLLEARSLRRQFGGVVAVDDVSFSVDAGEVVGIVGANGCGKTTTINMLTRLIDVTAGSVHLDGTEYTSVAPHRLVGMGIARTFQHLRLFHDLTVEQNVALGARTPVLGRRSRWGRWHGESELRAAARRALEEGGIADLAGALPRELPYGAQRLVEIARALVTRPRLLLLDEPFAGMATEEAAEVSDLLRRVHRDDGLTVVVIDHNIEALTALAPRLVAFAQGRVIADGSSAAVLAAPQVIASYVGSDV